MFFIPLNELSKNNFFLLTIHGLISNRNALIKEKRSFSQYILFKVYILDFTSNSSLQSDNPYLTANYYSKDFCQTKTKFQLSI